MRGVRHHGRLYGVTELGFDEVADVRFGRTILVEVNGQSPAEARSRVREMCEKLLANPVIEDYEVTIVDDGLPR